MNDWELFLMELTGNDDLDVYEYCQDNFDCDFSSFEKIADMLLQLTPIVTTGLTDSNYHAFIDKKQKVMLAKLEVK